MNVHVSERIPWRNGEGGRKVVVRGEHTAFVVATLLEKLSVHLPICSRSLRHLPLEDLFWVVSSPPSTDPATGLAETLLDAAIEDERPQPPLVPPCLSEFCVRVYYTG